MPRKDVVVKIDVRKPSRLTDLGKPVIIARFAGDSTYESFTEASEVATKFGVDSTAHKIAVTLLTQGETSPASIAVATYDPEATGDTPKTPVAALTEHFEQDFYFVVADTQVVTEQKAIADYVESRDYKVYVTTVATEADLTTLKAQEYERTFVAVHETVGELPAEALIGGHGSKPAGSITYFNKTLVGITSQPFNDAKLTRIEAANGQAAVLKAGRVVISEGKVLSGEYLDIIHQKDWMTVNIEAAVQEVFMRNEKVGYSDRGISLLVAAVKNVMIEAVARGIVLVTDGQPSYYVNAVKRADTSATDRANRVYNGISFGYDPEGAIHSSTITGEIAI